jgi:hypothetical protein
VALGGAIVAAGLIETDALDRDGVAAYLNELAEANPELMEHVTTGGGLVDSLQMRSLLSASVLAGESGGMAREGGLRAAGIAAVPTGFGASLRDAAAGRGEDTVVLAAPATPAGGTAPTSLAGLMTGLAAADDAVRVDAVGAGRFVVYLPAASAEGRLVSGDASAYADQAVRVIGDAVAGASGEPAHVMLVGSGTGGIAAVSIAARSDLPGFVVDQVVTAGAPSAQATRLPASVRVLALEDRSDPVALLGSLVNATADNRTTVVYDAAASTEAGGAPYVLGARAADASDHPALVAEIERLRGSGYLAS